jgi:hypothetical protein
MRSSSYTCLRTKLSSVGHLDHALLASLVTYGFYERHCMDFDEARTTGTRTSKKILLGMGLETSDHDHCVFTGKLAPHLPPLYLGLYVDDFKYFSSSDETEKLFEKLLGAKCKVDFMGEVSWFLGCKYEW